MATPKLNKLNSFELWKAEKHSFDVWPDRLRWAEAGTPHAAIAEETCSA